MIRHHLQNFHAIFIPEPIPELLKLLGFGSYWDNDMKVHRIYELDQSNPRMRWGTREFAGGDAPAWQAFLSSITSAEHLR